MAFFVRDLVNVEPLLVQLVEPDDKPAQVLLIDSLRRLPVNLSHRGGVGECHLRIEHAHTVLEPFGVEAALVREAEPLNAAVATSAPYLPLVEDKETLLVPKLRSLIMRRV
jgi:hypothetical protein